MIKYKITNNHKQLKKQTMNLKQIIIVWLTFGVVAIVLDLTRPEHRKEYKGMNLFHAFGMMILFVAIGGLSFSMALSDYIEYRKRLKRKDEVIKMIRIAYSRPTYQSNVSTEDYRFIWNLKCSGNYGIVNDLEYARLKSIVENYNKTK